MDGANHMEGMGAFPSLPLEITLCVISYKHLKRFREKALGGKGVLKEDPWVEKGAGI